MFGYVSTLFLRMQRSLLPVQCSSAVETEGLENRCLLNFPSVGKRNVGAIEHYYRGGVWLKPLSVHEEEWALLLAFGAWGLEQLTHLLDVGNSNTLNFKRRKASHFTHHRNISFDWIDDMRTVN